MLSFVETFNNIKFDVSFENKVSLFTEFYDLVCTELGVPKIIV